MPRAKLPPTPADSTGPIPREKDMHEMETSFVLPAAASQPSPPTSPIITRKRTLSGGPKGKDDLPPPPSRARKIIQMKPKEEPVVSTTPATATTPTKTNTTQGKRKQPSATSAAGRKIARKTAHSIIERRRRSKMNEEFGVLKDMIPACKGVEMHKLAILQAGIEYVRYLQGCVEKLQDRDDAPPFQVQQSLVNGDGDDHDDDDDEMDQDEPAEDSLHAPTNASSHFAPRAQRQGSLTTTATVSTHPSPALRPNLSSSSLASQRHVARSPAKKVYSTSPPPLALQAPSHSGVSPAFNAIHFSPDLGRTYSHTYSAMIGNRSPNILPLPQAAMSISSSLPRKPSGPSDHYQPQQAGDVHAEAIATAALMTMGSDRRSTSGGRSGGMSVKDLLSH